MPGRDRPLVLNDLSRGGREKQSAHVLTRLSEHGIILMFSNSPSKQPVCLTRAGTSCFSGLRSESGEAVLKLASRLSESYSVETLCSHGAPDSHRSRPLTDVCKVLINDYISIP